jgi:ribosomal protein L12E/L44/L45/RPP1/RPP2
MKKLAILFTLILTGTLNAQETNLSQIEQEFNAAIDSSRFKTHLQELTERPHVSGINSSTMYVSYCIC